MDDKAFKKRSNKMLWIIAVVLIALLFAGANYTSYKHIKYSINDSEENKYDTSIKKVNKKYNMQGFSRIKLGMSKEDAENILGEPTTTAESGMGNSIIKYLTYENSDNSNILLSIENNKIISKAQTSLENMNANATKSKYDSIKSGMTYNDCKKVLGEGQLVSEGNILNVNSKVYQWINNDGSNMNIIFQNDKVLSKLGNNLA